jgi:exonuclease SbcD
MIKILHFADAHIDISHFGRHDPETGLPLRVIDFLNALDTIVDSAIKEKVDLVIFAGDAYRDRAPVPTFQREWGKRMMRLSQAKIPTLLVVGNHDLSPAAGRAHALQEYETLEVPYIRVISHPELLNPHDLFGLPLQVIGLPWVTRSGLLASLSDPAAGLKDASAELELRVVELLKNFLNQLNPELPAVLTAHASVQGAMYGNERSVMLGKDIVLPSSLVRDPRLDYVALGHIHKPQELNSNAHPPVIYPGSIERVDFGEVDDDKHFVIAQVEKGKTRVEWRKLVGRKFFDRKLELVTSDDVQGQLERILPPPQAMKDAIGRLNLYYPREWEAFIDEPALRRYAQAAFEFHFFRHPQIKIGARLPAGESLLGKTTADQLDFYWKNMGLSVKDLKELKPLAEEIMAQVHSGFSPDQNDEPL